jgi:phage terminase small subunit
VSELTPKQQRFVEEYLITLNATQAALNAGYSPRSARQQGHENLTKPYIAAAIQQALQERSERTRVKSDRVVTELARLALYDPRDVVEWGPDGIHVKDSAHLGEGEAQTVAHIRVTFTRHGRAVAVRFADKLRALEILGRHLELFSGRVEVSGQTQEPIRTIKVNEVGREDTSAD